MLKNLALMSLCVVSSLAFAEVRHEISSVNSVSYDGQMLKVGYTTGGGCQPHRGEVQLVTVGNSFRVKLEDVSPKFDGCEALLHKQVEVDLKEMVIEAAKDVGLDANQFEVSLPKLRIRSF